MIFFVRHSHAAYFLFVFFPIYNPNTLLLPKHLLYLNVTKYLISHIVIHEM